jgi:hypothetical protein
MNIFYLNHDPVICAEMHVDKHCVKMIIEYAQLLSTAHRYLDGKETIVLQNGRKMKRFILGDYRESILYTATHINHPSAIWARQSTENYKWLYSMFVSLLKEYTYRYGKHHKCEFLLDALADAPNNLPEGKFTQPTPAMPDEFKVSGDSIQSYHNYYLGSKSRMFSWKNRNTPAFVAK